MKIYPVYNNNVSLNTPNKKTVSKPKFTAHPDYDELYKLFSSHLKTSNYFRRGGYHGTPSEEFVDNINTLRMYFSDNMNGKIRMLIGGIADSQESFSLLAVIKHFIKNRHLDDVLDLHIVDLQSKPNDNYLYQHSFYDFPGRPKYMPDSFVMENFSDIEYSYRVNDEIFNYLKSVYNNPKNSHWDSRIQDVVYEYPKESFNVISVNNTLTYIKDSGVILDTAKQIINLLKPKGSFITDPHMNYSQAFPYGVDEIYRGIYKKKSYDEISNFKFNPFIITDNNFKNY